MSKQFEIRRGAPDAEISSHYRGWGTLLWIEPKEPLLPAHQFMVLGTDRTALMEVLVAHFPGIKFEVKKFKKIYISSGD